MRHRAGYTGFSAVVNRSLTFELYATSWTFKAGYSLRISIACADSPTFEQNPAVDENTVVKIYHNSKYPSKITMPIIPD